MTTRIVQISDSHISRDHPQRSADLEKCIQHINAEQPPPDAVIHTGDVAHDGLTEEYNTARPLLNNLSVPYYVLAGNRDNRQELIRAFADDRHIVLGQKWVQYSIEHFPVRLLMVDTMSLNSNKGKLCQSRLDHLKQMLDADTSRPVYLFLHHPPFEATGIPDPYQYEDWAEVDHLLALLSRYAGIRALYCGHVHRNIDSSVNGWPASAISCLAGDLRKGKVSDRDRELPIFRMLTLS